MNFDNYPKVHDVLNDGTLLSDIANHCQKWDYYKVSGSKVSSAHESTHGINNQIRLTASNKVNGFYVCKDRSIIINEPNCRKSDASKYIPKFFRKSRYHTYVVGQKEWDDSPLYLFDEWTAYSNSAWTAIDLQKKGLYDEGNRDNIYGTIEFIAYGTAILMASNTEDQKLIDFCKFMIIRSFNAYYEAKGQWDFGEGEIVKELQSGAEGKIYRDYLKDFVFPSGSFLVEDY